MAAVPVQKLPQLAGGQTEMHRNKQQPWPRRVYSREPRSIGNDVLSEDTPCCLRCQGRASVGKADNLRKTLEFAEREHAIILKRLQEEVERLKAENKGKRSENLKGCGYLQQFSPSLLFCV